MACAFLLKQTVYRPNNNNNDDDDNDDNNNNNYNKHQLFS